MTKTDSRLKLINEMLNGIKASTMAHKVCLFVDCLVGLPVSQLVGWSVCLFVVSFVE